MGCTQMDRKHDTLVYWLRYTLYVLFPGGLLIQDGCLLSELPVFWLPSNA